MADFGTVIQNLHDDGQFVEAARLPQLQFYGPRNRRYLGAEFLPEQTRERNEYRERNLHLVDVIASDIDRNSPPPFKGSFVRAGSFFVEFGDTGLALQMDTETYSRILRMLGNTASMDRVAAQILNFNGSIISGMLTKNEVQRWEAIRNGVVNRVVDEVVEPVEYPNNPGQRVAMVNVWSSDAYNPIPDFFAQNTRAQQLGFAGVGRIVATQDVVDILMGNDQVKDQIGNIQVVGAGGGREYRDFAEVSQLDAFLNRNRLPAIEVWDETFRDQTGVFRYLPPGTIIFFYGTALTVDAILDEPLDSDIYVPDNRGAGLGYTGIGTPHGHEDLGPGRWSGMEYRGGARPNVYGEGVQVGLPVFNEPNGFGVYTNIR